MFNRHYSGFPLTVQFRMSRNSYRRCHFAVETAVDYLGESFLFPNADFEIQHPRIVVVEEDEEQSNSENLQQVT